MRTRPCRSDNTPSIDIMNNKGLHTHANMQGQGSRFSHEERPETDPVDFSLLAGMDSRGLGSQHLPGTQVSACAPHLHHVVTQSVDNSSGQSRLYMAGVNIWVPSMKCLLATGNRKCDIAMRQALTTFCTLYDWPFARPQQETPDLDLIYIIIFRLCHHQVLSSGVGMCSLPADITIVLCGPGAWPHWQEGACMVWCNSSRGGAEPRWQVHHTCEAASSAPARRSAAHLP